MFRKLFPWLILLLLGSSMGHTEGYSPKVGEVLEYKVVVRSAIHGGNQTVKILSKGIFNGRDVYHIQSEMMTIGFVKSLYKYHQTVELILDAEGLYPWFIKKEVHEKKSVQLEEITFDYSAKKAVRFLSRDGGTPERSELDLPGFVQDELSLQFFLRKDLVVNSENKVYFYSNGNINENCFKVTELNQGIKLECGFFEKYIQIIDDVSKFAVYVSDTPERVPLVVKTKGNIGLIEMKLYRMK